MQNYGWKDYGGHHHESIFTRFTIGYWLPQKFGIDKRKVTYSAQVRSGFLNRDIALKKLAEPPYDPALMKEDIDYVCKKLGLSDYDFGKLMKETNKSFRDYKSYYPFFDTLGKYGRSILKLLPTKPMMSFELINTFKENG